jgi:uncharacterized protein (TIGR03382 family)
VGRAQLGLTQSITYVGKQTTTDFTGLGQHLQYWPLFGRSSEATARRTDDEDCIELTPDFASFKHHYIPDGRTFSNDALGIPIGTKTRGGAADWPIFTLPDGSTGRSGTFYDESNIDNSNNTVNLMRINVSTLHEFCLNLVTDNTQGQHNADVRFEARSDTVDLDIADHPDFGFDGQTDMYTFRYQGMAEDDVFKIRLQCSASSGCQGAGLGGIMVSDISTCTESADVDAGAIDDTPDAAPVSDSPDADLGNPDPGAEDGEDGGCGCQSNGSGTSGLASLLLLAGLCLSMRRRRWLR